MNEPGAELDDERSLREPFWTMETPAEARLVDVFLRRRFPVAYRLLAEALEATDPLDVVYPDNPGEYDDVVREILVLLAPVNGSLAALNERQVHDVIVEGLARRFGEEPDPERVRQAVCHIVTRVNPG